MSTQTRAYRAAAEQLDKKRGLPVVVTQIREQLDDHLHDFEIVCREIGIVKAIN